MNYNVVPNKPKFYWLLKLLFIDYDPDVHAVSFGNTVYIPFELPDPTLLLVHEEVHLQQQRYSRFFACFFLLAYRLSKKFRLKVELEAFTTQYLYFVSSTPVTRLWYQYRDTIASELSSSIYGYIITKKQVVEHLNNSVKQYAK